MEAAPSSQPAGATQHWETFANILSQNSRNELYQENIGHVAVAGDTGGGARLRPVHRGGGERGEQRVRRRGLRRHLQVLGRAQPRAQGECHINNHNIKATSLKHHYLLCAPTLGTLLCSSPVIPQERDTKCHYVSCCHVGPNGHPHIITIVCMHE